MPYGNGQFCGIEVQGPNIGGVRWFIDNILHPDVNNKTYIYMETNAYTALIEVFILDGPLDTDDIIGSTWSYASSYGPTMDSCLDP